MRLEKHLNEITVKNLIQKLPDNVKKLLKKEPFDVKGLIPILRKKFKNLTSLEKSGSNTYLLKLKGDSPRHIRTIDLVKDIMKIMGVAETDETTVTGDVDTTPHMDVPSDIGTYSRKKKTCPDGMKWDKKKGKCVKDTSEETEAQKHGCKEDEYW